MAFYRMEIKGTTHTIMKKSIERKHNYTNNFYAVVFKNGSCIFIKY